MPEPALPTPPQQIDVPLDTFSVTERDDLLCATVQGSLVVCLYDAVEEAGSMLHLRVVPSRSDRSASWRAIQSRSRWAFWRANRK